MFIIEDVCDGFYVNYLDKGIFGIGGDYLISYLLIKVYLKVKCDVGKCIVIIYFDVYIDLFVECLGIDLCFGLWCIYIFEYLFVLCNFI